MGGSVRPPKINIQRNVGISRLIGWEGGGLGKIPFRRGGMFSLELHVVYMYMYTVTQISNFLFKISSPEKRVVNGKDFARRQD